MRSLLAGQALSPHAPHRPLRAPMATPPFGSSSSGTSTAATAAKLRDEALITAQTLEEEEAASLYSTNTERSQQLQAEIDLLKFTAAAPECIRAATDALEQQAAVPCRFSS